MSFQKLFGYKTHTKCADGNFFKYYEGISDYHWERIIKTTLELSDMKIGPPIISIRNNCIVYKEIIPLDPSTPINISSAEITRVVEKMHQLGYAHGDLHMENIGYDNDGNIYILDHDTVYTITDSPDEWVRLWMEKGFDWVDTFNEFIEYDYDNWRTDWLE